MESYIIRKKSSRSNGSGGNNCVEVTKEENGTYTIRDTKEEGMATQKKLNFTKSEWDAFVAGVKDGEFNF